MAVNPLGNGIDPLASHRRAMEQVRRISDPMAEVRHLREAMKPLDPLDTRQVMDQMRKTVDPMAEYQRWRKQTKPDPLASYRRAVEQVRRISDPMEEVKRLREAMQPLDPLGTSQITDQARRVMDPMGEYRRIVQNFSGLVGIDPDSLAADNLENEGGVAPDGALDWSIPNAPLVVALLAIAWSCHWLLAEGADVERVGSLLLAALGLAAYLANRS